jgi:hypothetical protein
MTSPPYLPPSVTLSALHERQDSVLYNNLTELVAIQAITPKLEQLSIMVWDRLQQVFLNGDHRCLQIPSVCPGNVSNLMYTWNKDDHYLECEIFEEGEIEFFYRNRNTGETWGEDVTSDALTPDQTFSEQILQKTGLFVE